METGKYISKVNYNGCPGYRITIRLGDKIRTRYCRDYDKAVELKKEMLADLRKTSEDFFPHNIMQDLKIYDLENVDIDYVVANFEENLAYIYEKYPHVFSEQEKEFIRLKYVEELNRSEIGRRFDYSRERVRQILGRAIKRMSNPKYLNILILGKDYANSVNRPEEVEKQITEIRQKQIEQALEGLDQEIKEIVREVLEMKGLTRKEILLNFSSNLEDLGLSVRSYNGLARAGYTKISEVIKLVDEREKLYSIDYLGTKSVKEIIEKVSDYKAKQFE